MRNVPISLATSVRVLFAAMDSHIEMVLRAAAFAAEKHSKQRRKDEEASPYINHPIQLAYILVQAGIEDPLVLAGALLHDTIEDTNTTLEELQIVFGYEIAGIVAECSDDKRLTKLERKQAQIDHAAHISKRARLVKIADKIANVNDINDAPPAGWSLERKREYFDWAKRVVDQMRGTHPALEARFDAEYAKRP
jgi:GTP diphosphokinase / guanosine-3',5'-bis(diphosphate) 3'-diphosphatase